MAQGLAVLAAPVLTRIYKPSDFGILQIFISVLGLGLVACSGRYEVAILLPDDEQSATDILAVALLCVCISTLIASALVLGIHLHHLSSPSLLILEKYLWILPLSLFGAGIYQVLSYWAIRHGQYRQLASTKVVQAGAQVGTQLAGGLLVHGPFVLLLGDAVGRIMGSGRFLRDLLHNHAENLKAVRLSGMFRAATRYRKYPLISIWGALINSSGLALPSIFLAQYFCTQDTGWFALVNRVLGVPGALIGASIAQVYASEAAKLSHSDPTRLMQIFLKTTRKMLFFGLAPCALFTILAPVLFQTVFGHAWREAGEYARYMAFMFYASFIDSPLGITLNVLEHQGAQFAWDLSRLILTFLAIAAPHILGYGPRIAILAYSAAMTFMYCIHWVQSYFAVGACVKSRPLSLQL